MKAVAVAVAAAGLVGSVSAGSHNHKAHAHLHVREDQAWGDWDPTTSTTTSSTTTTTSSETWADWDPTTSTTTTSSETWGDWDPATSTTTSSATTTSSSETWGEWDEPTTYTTVTGTVTKTITLDPATSTTVSWEEWDPSTSSSTTTSTKTSTKTSSTTTENWAEWTVDPSLCILQVYTSYGAATWYPDPSDPKTTSTTTSSSETWADWDPTTSTTSKTSSTTSSTETWEEWDPSTTTATTSSTETWEEWDPSTSSTTTATTSSTETWEEWDPTTSTTTTSTSTETWADWTTASTTASTATATSTSSSGKTTDSHGITTNGNQWSMTYSLFTASSGCKDAATVSKEISDMAAKGFTSVRVYSTECDTLELVGNAAREFGLKIILGVFISDAGVESGWPQVEAIMAWKQWDLVELIVLGNEAVFQAHCTVAELADFITNAAAALHYAGFTGAITTTEPLAEWLTEGSALCSVVDVVAANLYAFFNADTTADKAGEFIQAQIEELAQVCPGKDTYVMETGWPSAGNCNGVACPSPDNQKTAITSIQATTGSKVVFFSYENEAWKEPGEFGVEQYWGCADLFGDGW